jgi:hypothetical protein
VLTSSPVARVLFLEGGTMRYCLQCGSEYQEGVTECADCPGSVLVDAKALEQHRSGLQGEGNARRFVRAFTAEDPLTAEEFVRVLEAERIPVLARPRRTGTVDVLTTGTLEPWWDILVGEEHLERAVQLLTQEKARLEATADEAAQAAEEEERETEATSPPPSML